MASRAAIIGAIVRKDFREFSRDKFFMYVTVAGLVFYVAAFWLLPNAVNESITVGVHQTGMSQVFEQFAAAEEQGIEFVHFNSSGDLKAALGLSDSEAEEALDIGLDFPDDFLQRVAGGGKTTVQVYVDATVPSAIRRAMASFVRESLYDTDSERRVCSERSSHRL